MTFPCLFEFLFFRQPQLSNSVKMDPTKTKFPRLSSPTAELKPHYDVVVVGSGYGGSIAACRSAGAGKSVCLLEKGKEWLPGEFAETFLHAERDMHVHFGSHKFQTGMSMSFCVKSTHV
jgi:NADPH-dependent 2,4-dienoyl-CoA reductase/sulfur reductase-like enzyme